MHNFCISIDCSNSFGVSGSFYKTAPCEERRKFWWLRNVTGFCILEVLGRKNVLIRRNYDFEMHWGINSSFPSDVYIDECVIDKGEVTFSWKK